MMTWDDLDLFNAKVNFGKISVYMGKGKKMDIWETIAALDLKLARSRQLMESMKVLI